MRAPAGSKQVSQGVRWPLGDAVSRETASSRRNPRAEVKSDGTVLCHGACIPFLSRCLGFAENGGRLVTGLKRTNGKNQTAPLS
jgi:hypothetical protein